MNKIILTACIFLFLFTSVKVTAQSNDDCLMCHSDNTLTMEKNGKEVSLYVNAKILAHSTHGKLTCISCHTGFNIDDIPHKENIQPVNCKSCHENAPLKHLFHPQMLRTVGSNGTPDVSCKHCHGTHDVISPKVPGSKFYYTNLIKACGSCHKKEKDIYLTSIHFKGFKEGVKGAPNCISCHKNSITSEAANKDTVHLKLAQERVCLSCHLDNPDIRAKTTPSASFIRAYDHSIHATLLKNGNSKAANCVSCHTSHDIKDPSNPTSTINKFNIPSTCGKCHPKIEKEYVQSIHGVQALQRRNEDAPVCTDCHGEHNILKHDDPSSPVAYANLSAQVCSPCHSSVKLVKKYDISGDRYATFKNSYHGLALRGGSVEVANCASCHGVHNIKPSSDSTSSVNPKNLAKTCGRCHPGANENFTKGKIHVTMERAEDPILYWIATIYIILIVTVIGSMLLHNVMDFYKKARIKKLRQRGIVKTEPHGHALYLRMTLNERIQHISLALSFILLVITGFMLHFPDSWWVRHIRDISENAFIARSILHRVAAVVMVITSLYHIYYIAFTSRGRQLIKDLLPKVKDFHEAIGVAKFNLGLSSDKPKLGRFSYVEKAEYWALIWGTILMSITGVIMWFDNTFIGLLTKLGWDIARTIHYYEAWLAFLAIIVWHFYFIIFNPDVYPMNTACITGTMTEEEMAEEHPLELEQLKKENKNSSDSETNKN